MNFVSEEEAQLVKQMFREYYLRNADQVYIPKDMEKREYGYFTFVQKAVVRHLSFNDPRTLINEIKRVVPLHMHYSAAYYEDPSAPMQKKGWMGADLLFDIDADHISKDCSAKSVFLICDSCSIVAHDGQIITCTSCRNKMRKVDWPDEDCLKLAKFEVLKLLDFLQLDLGINSNDILVTYSGNRGYHVHVVNEHFKKIDQDGRREIVDYVTGTGIDLSLYGIGIKRRKIRCPDYSDKGWAGRIAKGMYSVMKDIKDNGVKYVSLRSRWAKELEANIENLLEAWSASPNWEGIKGIGNAVLKVIANKAVINEGVKIDAVVTSDVHRLARMGNTLNGKTGMQAKVIKTHEVETFDPFYDAVALPMDDSIAVDIIYCPPIRMGDIHLDRIKKEVKKVPKALATFILCKGLGRCMK